VHSPATPTPVGRRPWLSNEARDSFAYVRANFRKVSKATGVVLRSGYSRRAHCFAQLRVNPALERAKRYSRPIVSLTDSNSDVRRRRPWLPVSNSWLATRACAAVPDHAMLGLQPALPWAARRGRCVKARNHESPGAAWGATWHRNSTSSELDMLQHRASQAGGQKGCATNTSLCVPTPTTGKLEESSRHCPDGKRSTQTNRGPGIITASANVSDRYHRKRRKAAEQENLKDVARCLL
jgi:hypothetical protein